MLKNKYIKRAIILSVFLMVFFLFDWLLKHYSYDETTHHVVQWNYKVIAGRSLLHTSTTFLDFVGITMPFWVGQLVAWTIVVIFILIAFLSNVKYLPAFIGVLLAGVIGNTLDSLYNGGVRDIFFIPWMDRGTFNLADLLVVIGAGLMGLSVLVEVFKKDGK
ncbi:MAG: signal peptidase II [Mycoplasmataceae bacterium]|nr:signal peptidase II [Mycoplasmataceae bacterium]